MGFRPRILPGGKDQSDAPEPQRSEPAGAEGPSDAELCGLVMAGRDLEGAPQPASPAGRDAFALLVRRHEGRLLRLVRPLVGDADAARDVVQDAFLRAYRSLATFRPDGSFRSWLSRIAVNAARDERARAGRRPLQTVEDAEEPADTGPGTEDRVSASLLQRRLQEALGQLSRREREVFVLRELEDQDVDEIARVLELSPPTVRRHLARARLHLRQLLK
ncbi:MAG: sigma-70 family RNA polymerase sigma factor [Acidobacteriota bacterium]